MEITKSQVARIKAALQALDHSLTNWMEIEDPEEHRDYDDEAVKLGGIAQAILNHIHGKEKSGIMCKGRNGWFNFDHFNVIAGKFENSWVEVWSKRVGKESPLQFRCTTHEARELLADHLQEVVYKLKGGK